MHQKMAATVEECVNGFDPFSKKLGSTGKAERPRWPMIILRSPKGWTGPKGVDGHKVEGFWRAHQVPVLDVKSNPEHAADRRADWMRAIGPRNCSTQGGR
jgi:xylulose-5-phosphate/fructose-6-phosphate phosphoketolase